MTTDQASIDNRKLVRLELFDINDIRVSLKDFSLDDMDGILVNNEPSRFITKYVVDNPAVAKGQITLQLPRNGNIGFSQLSVQNSDVNITEWQPAPEDLIMIQLRMESWIEQDSESVAIGAIRQEIEKGKEDDTSAFHEMWTQIKVTADNFELAVKKDGIVQSINGSNEGLKIDFEKVNITGELLASLISAEHLDVSKGFRIVNGNVPVLSVDSDGNIIMNVRKLSINAMPALTEADRPQMEENIANELENKIKPYFHIAYADDESGNGFSFNSYGKTFLGTYSDNNKEPSKNPEDYEWMKVKGEDAYRVEVLSRNGDTFKNGVIDTWLYAVVYKGDDDITDELDIGRFRWERVSADSASDILWNQRYFGGAKEIKITTEDVYKRATFTCSITKQ